MVYGLNRSAWHVREHGVLQPHHYYLKNALLIHLHQLLPPEIPLNN
jgi:hypothetical protein